MSPRRMEVDAHTVFLKGNLPQQDIETLSYELKLRRVKQWLDETFQDRAHPHFEENETTVDYLYNILISVKLKTRDASVLIDAYKEGNERYKAEGIRLSSN